ncbi:MAG: transglutaminase family protein, partial [Gammaproteobacteria bacterium]|nr:transglutaminase family protein [Gammaproteobacteria bacterium]
MTRRRYRIEHVSSYRYKELAQSSLMLLRLRPRDDGSQRVLKFSLDIDPFAATTQFEDPFGNRCHLFNVHRLHRSTVVHSRVQVESAGDPELPERLGA